MKDHRRQLAVLAHFDTATELAPVNRTLVLCLLQVCERVIIVSTSKLYRVGFLADERIDVIERPNVGYDFYSYRVGLHECVTRREFDGLFLVNTSFMVCNTEKFVDTLVAMATRADGIAVTGLTESRQFEPHLQSYLVHLTRGAVLSPPFRAWYSSIEPQADKMQMILRYELGFTRSLRQHGLNHAALFTATAEEDRSAMDQWKNCCMSDHKWFDNDRSESEVQLVPASPYNPVHFNAEALALRHGLVKSELVRTNPHRLNTDWLTKSMESRRWLEIQAYAHRSSRDYAQQSDGLTVFQGKARADAQDFVLIPNGRLGRGGVEIAAVVHVFYPELIPEICEYLSHILQPFDLFITTPHEHAVPSIIEQFSRICSGVCVVLHKNIGRDIGPFMSVYRAGLLDRYKAVLKAHSKQSKYSEAGAIWRKQLYGSLCGESPRVQATLDLLACHGIGLVGPDDSFLTHPHFWGGNRERVATLLSSIGVADADQPIELGFFAGSMFWFKPRALTLLKSIPSDILSYEPEAGQRDATLAHAIERIFSHLAAFLGYVSTTVELAGADVQQSNISNKVVVLTFNPLHQAA